MARPTQKEIDEFNARMNEPEGEEDTITIEYNGHKITMKESKAMAYLKRNGIDLSDVEITQPDADGEDTLTDPKGKAAKPPTSAKYFGKDKQ